MWCTLCCSPFIDELDPEKGVEDERGHRWESREIVPRPYRGNLNLSFGLTNKVMNNLVVKLFPILSFSI